MDIKNEISALSTPAICTDKEAVEQVPKNEEETQQEGSGLINPSFDHEANTDHKGENEEIEKLPADPTPKERKSDKPMEHVEQRSSLEQQPRSSGLVAEDDGNFREPDGAHLIEKVHALEGELFEFKRHLQSSQEENAKLVSELDSLKGAAGMLEKQLADSNEKFRKDKENLSSEANAARQEVTDLKLEQENLIKNKSELEKLTSELRLQLKSMEERASRQAEFLEIAENNLKDCKEEVVSLQQQVADVMLKEAGSAEHLKEVKESAQKLQLELQSKLENVQGTILVLQEKVEQLEGMLSASELDRDGAKKNVSELEAEMKGLHLNHDELSEKVKMFEDKCSQHESSAHVSSSRIAELEETVAQFKMKADAMNSDVVTLEVDLLNSQKRASDLELQLSLAKDSSAMCEERSAARIAELEERSKENISKVQELQTRLADKQKEIDSSADKIHELKLSIDALESNLKNVSDREMLMNEKRTSVEEELAKLAALTEKLEAEKHELEFSIHEHLSSVEKGKTDLKTAVDLERELKGTITTLQATISELQALLTRTEEEKQATANTLESLTKSFGELNDQLVSERKQLQQQIVTVVQENEDLRQTVAIAEEKLRMALSAEEDSAKRLQESFLKESTLAGQLQDFQAQLKEAHDICANLEDLQKEKTGLARDFANAQEKLGTICDAAKVSARELEESSLRELTLKAETEDLKAQLEKAMDACSQVTRLEQTLQSSISKEEHQTQIDKVLAASRLTESKLADLEAQLLKSTLEMKNAQSFEVGQETQTRDLDFDTVKAVEIFETQHADSAFTKAGKINSDAQSPEKARMRKKKGVTWESDVLSKPKEAHKPSHHLVNSYVALMLVALASLMVGFWLASTVDF